MYRKLFVTLLGIGLFLAACAQQPGSLPVTGDEQTPSAPAPVVIPSLEINLAGTEWMLQSFGKPGEEIPPIEGTSVTLKIEPDGRITGTGGCNSYGADVQIGPGSLTIGPITSTKKACLEDSATQQEQEFFNALQSAARFELVSDRLTLTSADGEVVLNFVKSTSY